MNGFMAPGPFKSSIYECIFNSNSISSNTNIETWYNGIIDVGNSYAVGSVWYTHITITISNINEYIYYQGFENDGEGYGSNVTPYKITGLSLNSTIVNSSSTQILKYKITDINNISLDLVNTGWTGWHMFTFLI